MYMILCVCVYACVLYIKTAAAVDIMKEKIEIGICLHDAVVSFFVIKFKMTKKLHISTDKSTHHCHAQAHRIKDFFYRFFPSCLCNIDSFTLRAYHAYTIRLFI